MNGVLTRQYAAMGALSALFAALSASPVQMPAVESSPARSHMTYEEMAPYFVKAAQPVIKFLPPTALEFPETVEVAAREPVIPVPQEKPVFIPDVTKIPVPVPRPVMEPVRSLKIYNTHTDERVEAVFRRGPVLDAQGLDALRDILKDHRLGQRHQMATELFDLLADIKDELERRGYKDIEFQMVSGYRSPITNKKLKNTKGRGGQADNSRHMHGEAIDIRVEGVPRTVLRDVAWCVQRGGVGDYPGTDENFVHVDVFKRAPNSPSYPGQKFRTWGWEPKAGQCKAPAP